MTTIGYLARTTFQGKMGFAITQQAFADTAPHAVQALTNYSGVVNVYHAFIDDFGAINHDGYHLVHSFNRFDEVLDYINRAVVE